MIEAFLLRAAPPTSVMNLRCRTLAV